MDGNTAKSATDVLVAAMEEFGKSEPKEILVLYTDDAGDLVRISNASGTSQIGFCEVAKSMVLKELQ